MKQANYHIHFDGKVIAPALEKWATGHLGFWWDNFLHEEGAGQYAPDRHLTQKPKTGEDFKRIKYEIFEYLRIHPAELTGYVECEVISRREEVAWKEFDPSVDFPFSFDTTTLTKGTFRESEIHVSMGKDASDLRLFETLKKAGLFVALNEREHGTDIIFTVQGYRDEIGKIWEMLHQYLLKAGGSAYCKMKEEVIVDYWLSSPDYPLPPVVSTINP